MGKHQISMNDTISTRTFMNNYLGINYDLEGHLTHEKMIEYLLEKGEKIPACVNMDLITKEDIASGRFLLVRAERKNSRGKFVKSNKKVKVLAYQNPLYLKEKYLRSALLSKETLKNNEVQPENNLSAEELRKKRNEYLINLSLIEDEFGNIMDLEIYMNYSEEIPITSKCNRIKVLGLHRGMRKRDK